MTEQKTDEQKLPPIPPKCLHCQSTEHTTDGHFEGGEEPTADGHFEGGSVPAASSRKN